MLQISFIISEPNKIQHLVCGTHFIFCREYYSSVFYHINIKYDFVFFGRFEILKTPDGEINGSLKLLQSKKGDWTWKEQVNG